MENNIANSRGKSIEQAGGLLMAFRKFFPTLPLRSLLACIFVFVAAGCDSGPGSAEWSASSLASTVKELKANGINASAGTYFMPGLGNDASYLGIRLESTIKDRPMPRLQVGMSDNERNAIAAEQDAIRKANRLVLKEAAQRDFEVLARLLRDKEIPLLRFSGPGASYIVPYLSTLQCKSLGLWLDFAPGDNLRDLPALKSVYVDGGHKIDGSVVLPQVEDVAIVGASTPVLFSLEPVTSAFPNMRSLTIPGRAVPIDYGAVKFPASLTGFSITSGGNPVINAYNLNGAKNLPGITRINGVPVDTFDPVKNLTPEQLVQYNAIPAHIWAEKRFAAFLALAQPEKSGGSVPLRGKIMLHAQGDFLPQEVREGVDERLRNAMTENADECDVLVVIATQEYQRPDLRWVGDSAPVIDTITVMRIFSKNGENEAHAVFFEPKLSNVTEDQKERNARYLATGVWGEMELLFKKGNAE